MKVGLTTTETGLIAFRTTVSEGLIMEVQTPYILPRRSAFTLEDLGYHYSPTITPETLGEILSLWRGAERLLYSLQNDKRISSESRILHIGTTYQGILRLMDPNVVKIAPIINGDGWQAWGEDLDVDINDGSTQHVKFYGTEIELWETYNRLLDANIPLIPMGPRAEPYSKITATFTDWEEENSYLDFEILK